MRQGVPVRPPPRLAGTEIFNNRCFLQIYKFIISVTANKRCLLATHAVLLPLSVGQDSALGYTGDTKAAVFHAVLPVFEARRSTMCGGAARTEGIP